MRLPGVPTLEAKFDEQNRATAEHRKWEKDTLDGILEQAKTTNGRLTIVEKKVDILEDREAQEATRKAARAGFKQQLLVGAAGVTGTVILYVVVNLLEGKL